MSVGPDGHRPLRRRLNRASVLGFVLLICAIAGILALALMQLSIRTVRTGAWSRDHLMVRLLVESAVEELWLRLQDGANTPGDPVFEQLRTMPFQPRAVQPLASLKLESVPQDFAELERSTGSRISVLKPARGGAWVQVVRVEPISGDYYEREGIVRFQIGLSLAGMSGTVQEQLTVERSFRISRTELPRLPRLPGPNAAPSLIIGVTDRATLPNFCPPGSPLGPPAVLTAAGGACSRRDGAFRTLLEVITEPYPQGLGLVPPALEGILGRAMGDLAAERIVPRAQFVTRSAGDLLTYVQERLSRGLPVHGLLHNMSEEPLTIGFTSRPFRGRCLISSAGPIEVGDVALADRGRDALTLVSPRRILVTGRSVEASLICTGPDARGVQFANIAQVLGPVVTARFPRGVRLTGAQLGRCEFGANSSLACAAGPQASAGSVLDPYRVAFSPYPILVEHARD